MSLLYKDREEIINYNIYVYNPEDDFEFKPLEDKIEITLRVWFPEYFSNSRLDDILPIDEFIYLFINYYLKDIIGFFFYLIEVAYEDILPIYERFIEIIDSIINPVFMTYFQTNIRNSLMDLFIDYNAFEVSNFNFCVGGGLLAFSNLIILNNSFFLTSSNLFNDFSFFEYYYEKEVEQLVSYIEQKEIEEVVIVPEIYLDGRWDNLRALIRWLKARGIEFIEFVKKDRREIEYSHVYCGIILETSIDLLSKVKQSNGLSMQNLLINVFSDNNYCSDLSRYTFQEDYAYLLTYDSYESKLYELDEYLKSWLEIEIDTNKLYRSLIFSYFLYRYSYSFIRSISLFIIINRLISILAYLEKSIYNFVFKKDPKKTLARFDKGYPSKNPKEDLAPKVFKEKSKEPLLNRFVIKSSDICIEEYYEERMRNYLLYNLFINKLATFFYYLCLKFINKTIIFGYLDLIGYYLGKIFKIYYYETIFMTFLLKKVDTFFSQTNSTVPKIKKIKNLTYEGRKKKVKKKVYK